MTTWAAGSAATGRRPVDDPHFEKDAVRQRPAAGLYAEAWSAGGRRPLFKHICERVAEWAIREMQSPLGGYYASLDADSEGEEGRFYVWTPAEVSALLEPDEYRVFSARFGLDRAANFEGRWHLHTFTDTAKISADTGPNLRRSAACCSAHVPGCWQSRQTRPSGPR